MSRRLPMRLLEPIAALAVAFSSLSCSQPVGPVYNRYKAECRECDSDELLALCADGQDNDQDYLTDCEDPDCRDYKTCAAVLGPENTVEACTDGVDNDGNSFVDCKDFGCQKTTACRTPQQEPETSDVACLDGLDNDWDGNIDCRDSDCQGDAVTVCEGNDKACSDGLDNDENGFTDCGDYSCSKSSAVTVCN